MAKLTREENNEIMRKKLLYSAAKLFLENGYSDTSIKQICEDAQINTGSFFNMFGCKDNLLAELVAYVLEGQFKMTKVLLTGVTDDRILYYAAETTLQLYMTESSENVRNLYSAAYSLPNTTKIIQDTITSKLEDIFKEHLPDLESKDFYEREIASGGIMRGFLTVPCDRYFTMERKVTAFLESTFKIYDVPMEKIKEAIAFVSQFDFKEVAKETIDALLEKMRNEKSE